MLSLDTAVELQIGQLLVDIYMYDICMYDIHL